MPVFEKSVSFWRRDWFWALLLSVLVFIAYAQAFRAGFIWDDESHLTRNPCVIGPLGLKEIWTSAQAVYYPLVLTTFWTLHKLIGLNPLPYHALNVLLHASSAILFWRVLKLLQVRGAWFGAALWALHPVMVQSVAWITELKNTQSCLFYLLSIFLFLVWEKREETTSQQCASSFPVRTGKRWAGMLFASSLLCFTLATLSKTSVVMLPFVLVLCIWWLRGKIHRRDVLAFAPFAVVSLFASAWTVWEQKFHAHAVGPDWSQSLPERFIIAGRAIWFYLSKLIWPHPLIFIYPRWEVHSGQLVAWLPLLGALFLFALIWSVTTGGLFQKGNMSVHSKTSWTRAVFFATAYYVISLFPVLGFFSVYFFRYSFVSDHFQYLASMGPLALAGAGMATFGARLFDTSAELQGVAISQSQLRNRKLSFFGICAAFLVLLGFLTWRQTAEYHDLAGLYTATIRKNPDCWMAHYNLGIVLGEQGEIDQAITHYRQAITLRSDYAEAHYNLARLLIEQGRLDEAIGHYEKAVEINPADPEGQNNLGVTLFGVGRVDDAIAHYRKALQIRPNYPEACCNLANALIATDDIDGAIARYSACLSVIPNQPEAQYNLASALLRKGRIDEAIIHYKKALQLQPRSADARANLGSALLKKGRVRDAASEYAKALEISPENVAALSNLAWLLATSADASLRNGSKAVVLAERAESAGSRSENQATVLRTLAAAYAEVGRFDDAKKTAQRALETANAQGDTVLAGDLEGELALYDLRLPYHK
ncbi:MAG TPA: tetratricopeptide repeat protein [Candidatus Udaeobacter sp.]|nr:tetratricopeptide repeat protein [Candidatus Udaeobacter sp.]